MESEKSITGTILHNKIREIFPGLPSGITPEVLNKTCDDPTTQPFLRWFCSNVSRVNYLGPEDVILEKQIRKNGEWLEGEELESALVEATANCPELRKLACLDAVLSSKISDDLEAETNAYEQDTEYLRTLQDSLKNLKELSSKVDDDIETEESLLEKDGIRTNLVYAKCIAALEQFDSILQQFVHDIRTLLDVYSDAVQKKCTPIVWTQLPLDNFIKQMEMHNEYLGIYVKREFGSEGERVDDSHDGTLVGNSGERRVEDKIHQLLKCQTDVITSKRAEIRAKVREAASAATAALVIDISNDRTMIPQSDAQMRTEMAALTIKRDFHEKNIELLGDNQLEEVTKQYGRYVISRILVDDGHASAVGRKRRLDKLEKLRMLARERGHAHSDLLCMLMELQLRRLEEILEFIADGRHYLATEYTLSSVRSEIMREQQAKYQAIIDSAPRERNVFNKILMSLVSSNTSIPDDLNAATKQYHHLTQDNESRKQHLLGAQHDTRIDKLRKLENEITSILSIETKGATNSFKPTSYNLLKHLDESTRRVVEMEESFTEIRAKIKDMSKKSSENSFERDVTIMWQRFLASPDELQSKYDDVKKKVENSHFSCTSKI